MKQLTIAKEGNLQTPYRTLLTRAWLLMERGIPLNPYNPLVTVSGGLLRHRIAPI